MRLTVLGSAASYPGAGQACAGYLLESGDTRVLLDCGNGVLSNLGKLTDPTRLDAVFVTHGHIDHFADIYALHAALRYAPSGPLPPLELHAPEGWFDRMTAPLTQRSMYEFSESFDFTELLPGLPIRVGDLFITPVPVEHVWPTFGLKVTDGTSRLFYTSDAAPGPDLTVAAEGADVLLADATLPPKYAGKSPHMTAQQAAELAQEVGARTLILTHLWPSVDRTEARALAEAVFAGRVIVAEELQVI
jgi:ribonuclease BN (tRNA processing enzyme)